MLNILINLYKNMKNAVIVVLSLIIIGLIGTGIWYYVQNSEKSEFVSGQEITNVDEAIILVQKNFSAVSNIKKSTSPFGSSANIFTSESMTKDGWNLKFWKGSGDCEAGCLNSHEWYFTVTKQGIITKVGEYEKTFNSLINGYDVSGESLPTFIVNQ
jgi:hypothetical protein